MENDSSQTKVESSVLELSAEDLINYQECPKCFYLEHHADYDIKKPIDKSIESLLNETKNALREYFANYSGGLEIEGARYLQHEQENNSIEFFHDETRIKIFSVVDGLLKKENADDLSVMQFNIETENGSNEVSRKNLKRSIKNLDINQWLLSKNGYQMNGKGIISSVKLKGAVSQLPIMMMGVSPIIRKVRGNNWIDHTLKKIREDIDSITIPDAACSCEWCKYVAEINHGKEPFHLTMKQAISGMTESLHNALKQIKGKKQ
ncbi:hypothetical protein GF376_00525 [Candidatus Peregrinibacteria bacterium]|nr:hypothetical protein [Candidatus Peregrinibacteria bacterium]